MGGRGTDGRGASGRGADGSVGKPRPDGRAATNVSLIASGVALLLYSGLTVFWTPIMELAGREFQEPVIFLTDLVVRLVALFAAIVAVVALGQRSWATEPDGGPAGRGWAGIALGAALAIGLLAVCSVIFRLLLYLNGLIH